MLEFFSKHLTEFVQSINVKYKPNTPLNSHQARIDVLGYIFQSLRILTFILLDSELKQKGKFKKKIEKNPGFIEINF